MKIKLKNAVNFTVFFKVTYNYSDSVCELLKINLNMHLVRIFIDQVVDGPLHLPPVPLPNGMQSS